MQSPLSNLLDNLSEINNKKPNKFVNAMRFMTDSLSQSIDNKKPDNTFTDGMRSMVSSLSHLLIKYQKLTKIYQKLIINLQVT